MSYRQADRYEAKYDDPRANPHSSQYDPKFDPYVPMPAYHRFPQPVYRNYDDDNRRSPTLQTEQRQQPAYSYYTYNPPRYRQRPYYSYSNRPPYQNDTYKSPAFMQSLPRYQQQQQQQQQQHQQYQPQQPQQRQPPPYDNRDFNSPYYSQSSPRPEDPNMPRAGLATNYNTRITDLLTSIRDPVVKDHSLRRSMEVHKGYLVMMRVAPRSLAEVINAVQSNVSSIAAFEGYCLGFAEPCLDNTREIHMSSQRYHQEKNNGKVKVLKSSYAVTQDPWWEPRDSRRSPRFATVAFWFKDAVSANKCFESVGRFRQPDFPDCNRPQIVAVPLTYGKDMETPFDPERETNTFLWAEYPSIHERYNYDFMANYSEPARKMIRAFGGNPYISVSEYLPGWDPDLNKFGAPGYARKEVEHRRVGRSIKGDGWVPPRSIIAVSAFPDMGALEGFFYDPQHEQMLANLSRYSEPVMVGFTLQKIRGTNRV
ncbi:uncharacterized protein LOC128243922 isoform X2 [Mya arenaria]|uniref:uncharacterized protein LOC128243922 isoform X2 n=1 Tax=Mya arenaria TaxID=6604 RepID=UPI0022E0CC2D|nr:uncharacterized protein LOC128243922 isoform X2 [Mya arenaria]